MEVIKNILNFIIMLVFDLAIFIVLFRLILQFVGANYQNPYGQFALRYTHPIVEPLHRFFPLYKNIDFALLFILVLLESLKLGLLYLIGWELPNFLKLLFWSILLLFNTTINFYLFAVILRVLLSWIMPIYSINPAMQVLFVITEPLMRPLRNHMPHIGRFDFSPLVLIVVLKILSMIIIYMMMLSGAPRWLL